MGVAHMKCQNCWVSLKSHALGFVKSVFPHVEPSRGGRPRSITLAQIQVCVKSIKIGELDDDVDVTNALSEHLNVVVSTNTMRHALHEASFGSLGKHKKALWVEICSVSSRLD